jgi:hypothetical protein
VFIALICSSRGGGARGSTASIGALPSRLWKDHFKNDLRSDQDHVFLKMILDQDQDHRSIFAPKVPFLGVIF